MTTLREVVGAVCVCDQPDETHLPECPAVALMDRALLAGFDLDLTPEAAADGTAWRRLTRSKFADVVWQNGTVNVAVCNGDPLTAGSWETTNASYPTLAAAVAALEADDGE